MYKLHLDFPALLVVLELDLGSDLILFFLHEFLHTFRKQLRGVDTEHLAYVLQLLLSTGNVVFVEFDSSRGGELLD